MRRIFNICTTIILLGIMSVLTTGCKQVDSSVGKLQANNFGVVSFNSDWRFLRDDAEGAENPDFDDSDWRMVEVPHDWSIEDVATPEDFIPQLPVVEGKWRFQRGDDISWKTADFDDSAWQTVTLPETWENHSGYNEDNVYGWYRRNLEIPTDWKDKNFDILLGFIDDVDEAWLNGEHIGGTGIFPPDYSTAYSISRYYRVPGSLIKGDGNDVLAVRVYDSTGEGGIYQSERYSEGVGPFDPAQSAGGPATGYVVGGTGWYRKHFTLSESDAGKNVSIYFDGVYMNSDFWINGHHLGNHPYGYTPFVFNLTPYLKPAGQKNVLAVQVKNEGRNSRWYSGSGIYRQVELTIEDPTHIPLWGVHVEAADISKSNAAVYVTTVVENNREKEAQVIMQTSLIGPNGKIVLSKESEIVIPSDTNTELKQKFSVKNPVLWSLDNPALYRASVKLIEGNNDLDAAETTFGIRSLKFTAENGFELNGETVLLKGGCVHHDNGPIGSATIERAEERKVELMKEYGFNAIRTSHNPPSKAFLDACDRLGVLVVDEAFDMWVREKNTDDYHLYFNDWYKRDLESMLLRDRNHPSVIMWSVGNEINERAEPSGIAIREKLISVVRKFDSTRAVTEGICGFWDHPGKEWSDTAEAFAQLDVCGYNYQIQEYVRDHRKYPERIIMGTESYANAVYDNWQAVVNYPWVIGDFVWTAWDYMGETGLGNSGGNGGQNPKSFPWYQAFCGDIDLCGFKKPQLYYREVVWGDSEINMAVHSPSSEGQRERVSTWGWPDERQSWTWPGSEGKSLDVTVYSSCPAVRLELNGKEIATKKVDNKMTCRFRVPYEAGKLKAVGLSDESTVVASTSLSTAGEAKEIRLTADRKNIRADREDLCYVTVEIVDEAGTIVPDSSTCINFSVHGKGKLYATGNGAPNDGGSFKGSERNVYEGRCLVIVRPEGDSGTITLKAEAEGLKTAKLVIETY